MRHSRPQSSTAHDYQHKQLVRGGFEGWVPGEHKHRFYVLYIIGCAQTKPISVVFRSFSELMRHKFSCYIIRLSRGLSPRFTTSAYTITHHMWSHNVLYEISLFSETDINQIHAPTNPYRLFWYFREPSPNHGHSWTHVQTVISLRFIL